MNYFRKVDTTEKYSPEYDSLMNAELEVISGAYNHDGKNYYPPLSVKIPNKFTGMKMHYSYDGDQPSYDRWLERWLEMCELSPDESLADYPRHDSTLRLFWHCPHKASDALKCIQVFTEYMKDNNYKIDIDDLEYMSSEVNNQ